MISKKSLGLSAMLLIFIFAGCSTYYNEKFSDYSLYKQTVLQNKQKNDWTFLIYMAADNNLESNAIDDLNELEDSKLPENVTVLVLLDRSDSYDSTNDNWSDTRLYKVVRDRQKIKSLIVSERIDCPELGLKKDAETELDMADKSTLTGFLKYGRRCFPADHFALIVWGHGSGWRSAGLSGQKAFASDQNSSTQMSASEMGKAISAAFNDRRLDFLGFDTCHGVCIENAYEFRKCAKILAGSPSVIPDRGWNYTKLIDYFSESDFSMKQLGEAVQRQFSETFSDYAYGAFAELDLNYIEETVKEFNLFSEALAMKIVDESSKQKVFEIFTKKVVSYCADVYPCDLYVDLKSLSENTKEFCDSLRFQSALDDLIISYWSASQKESCCVGVYFAELAARGIFAAKHPDSYVNGAIVSSVCSFVEVCDKYVPSYLTEKTLLNLLFYKNFDLS